MGRRSISRNESVGGHLLQPLNICAVEAQFIEQRHRQLAVRHTAVTLPAHGTALDGCPMEETLGCGHCHEGADFPAAAGLSIDHYSAGIPAEVRNILPHPIKRGDEIQHADIRRIGVFFTAQFPQGQKAE